MAVVLLVDDDPDNHTLLSTWLRRMGHHVHSATSAPEALSVLDEHGVPDVAVLDIVMEHTDGLQLLDHLRRYRPDSAHLPAILLTARHLHTDRVAAQDLNAQLLIKPLDRARLATALHSALAPTMDPL